MALALSSCSGLTQQMELQYVQGLSVYCCQFSPACSSGHHDVVTCSTLGFHRVQQISSEDFSSRGVIRYSAAFSPEWRLRGEDLRAGALRACSSSSLSIRGPSSGFLLSSGQQRFSWSSGSLPLRAATGAHQKGVNEAGSASALTNSIVRAAAQVEEGAADSRPTSGVPLYKPASYDILVSDAARAVGYALDDKKQRIEVDFPPVPGSESGYKVSSDEFIDANTQLAFALARKLNENKGVSTRIVFPDGPEKRRGLRVFKSALQTTKGVTFGSLDDLPADLKGPARGILGSIKGFFDFDFEEDYGGKDSGEDGSIPDVYVILGASTNELPAVKEYIDHFAKNLPVVLFNLETDTLRADLGLFGFPSKDIHYKFLSQFLPVFYIRIREYSKSIIVPPFVVNYSGALLRQYPGPWQVMLKQVDGSYACVAENTQRYTLFQTKEELLISLGLQEEVGSTMAFLRSGYKTATWWEDTLEPEESQAWRN